MATFMERQLKRPLQENEQLIILRQARTIKRFEIKYIPEPNSGCWLWTAAVGKHGHGQFFLCKNKDQKGIINAHRASWMIYRGTLQADQLVCHICDMPCCVNPDHFFLGTHKDNSQDALKKNRYVFPDRIGEFNSQAILSEEDVLEIRESKLSKSKLAKIFGVTETCIREAQNGVTWKHLPGSKTANVPSRPYTKEELIFIANSLMPAGELSILLNRSIHAIHTIRHRLKCGQKQIRG
jgi:hypothetical protein